MTVEPDNDPIDLTPAEPTGTAATSLPVETEETRAAKLAAAREQILAALRERHTIQPPFAWALLGGGLLLMLTIGVVLAFVSYFVGYFALGIELSFTVWLLLYLLLMVPLVVWTERRAHSGFFSLMSADVDLTRDRDGDDVLLKRGADTMTSVGNAVMFGPRAFVAGLHALRGVPQKGLDLVLPEAAETLTLMLSIDGGVKIADLAPPGSDPLALMPVLKWLDLYDYIGISSRGDRVWVSSPAKKRFIERGIVVPKLAGE